MEPRQGPASCPSSCGLRGTQGSWHFRVRPCSPGPFPSLPAASVGVQPSKGLGDPHSVAELMPSPSAASPWATPSDSPSSAFPSAKWDHTAAGSTPWGSGPSGVRGGSRGFCGCPGPRLTLSHSVDGKRGRGRDSTFPIALSCVVAGPTQPRQRHRHRRGTFAVRQTDAGLGRRSALESGRGGRWDYFTRGFLSSGDSGDG